MEDNGGKYILISTRFLTHLCTVKRIKYIFLKVYDFVELGGNHGKISYVYI